MRNVARTLVLIVVCSTMLSAESAKSLHNKGVQAEARQDYEAAYDYYKQAYDREPTNLKYRVPFERMRFLAAAAKVHRGQKLREQGKLQDALILFQQAAAIDPSNDRAAQEVRRTQQMMQKSQEKPKAKEEEEDPLRRRLEQAAAPVQLGPISNIPLPALQYSEDSKIIYETIGKLAKINVLFDPDYQSRHLSISLQNVTLGEALDIVALESRTFWRPVTPNTIFVAADTQAKRRELEQNVIKTFYLGNVSGPTDIQDIVNAIRTVLEVQRIQQIPSQNAIVIKATPDQLAMAEKMIDDIDKSKPEVVVDVIVAQVRRDKLRNLGILPPQNAAVALQGTNVTTTPSGSGSTSGGTTTTTPSGGGLNFNDLQHLNSTNYAVTIDPVKAIALFNDTDTKIIQSPRIRASDNEKATLKIADKIPIATGSFGTPLGVGTAVGAVGVNTQFAYQDVGVIMEIQPRVHPEGQVTLKTKMEISNLNGQSTIGGISQPIISQRSVEHTIRLNDGEINLLGGILEQQVTKTNSGTPFLGQIPLLKYIFSQEQKEVVTNEIVFLLIPHIVRGQELNDLNRRAFDVGTGSGIDLHIAQRQPQVAPVSASVQQESATANPAPAYQPPAQPAVQPRPQPVAPPVQPAAAPPSTAPATNAAPANAVPTKPSPATGQTGLQFNPAMVSPTAGSQFALDVVMAHGQDIAAVPIQISYDPKVVEFVSVTNGDFLARDGQAVTLVHRDDPTAGKLQITAQRPPGSSGVSGDGIVFRLTFTAKAKGQGVVAIAIPGARNSQNQPIDVLGAQAAVNVN